MSADTRSSLSTPSLLTLCGRVLRAPHALVDDSASPAAVGVLAPRLLFIALGTALVFGAVVGSYRGGVQIAYAALKMPLLFVIPLLVSLPAVGAMVRVTGVPVDRMRLGMAGLVGMARTGLVAAAAAPMLWLCYSLSPSYYLASAGLAATLLLAGATGLPALRSVVSSPERKPSAGAKLAVVAGIALLGLTTAQTGWVLRPFVARPMAEVALVRPIEGNILDSLGRLPFAAAGIYLDYQPQQPRWREKGE